jgi:hypothetical protein
MLILLAIMIFTYNLGSGILLLRHESPSAAAQLLYVTLFVSGFGVWLHRDLERNKITPLYCSGLLLHTGWYILVPYYLYKARRFKALIPIAVLIGAFIACRVVAVVIYFSTIT